MKKLEPVAVSRKAEAALADTVARIDRGLAQAHEGMGRPADEVFDELERESDGEI